MKISKLLIIGNYGAGNLGDDAILGGILQDLKALNYKGEIEVMQGEFLSSPEIYSNIKKTSFQAAGFRSWLSGSKEAKKSIQNADLAILGGGGLFVDSESWKAPLIWAAQAKACQKGGTPYICYGQSVGPLHKALSRRLTAWVFKHAQAVHVRDQASADFLKKELGVPKLNLGTDLAFSWLNQQKRTFSRKNQMILVLRHWGEEWNASWPQIIQKAKTIAQKQNLELFLMSMDPSENTELNALKSQGLPLLIPASAKEAYEHIASSKALISMRLHASLFAIAAGTPLLAISYSDKVKNIFQQFKMPEAAIEWKDWNKKTHLHTVHLPDHWHEQNQAFLGQFF